jgi:hypothetical protein
MSINFPSHLNLEFCKTPHQSINEECIILCHIEVDDYGNKIKAIPLCTTREGHITLDPINAFLLCVNG